MCIGKDLFGPGHVHRQVIATSLYHIPRRPHPREMRLLEPLAVTNCDPAGSPTSPQSTHRDT